MSALGKITLLSDIAIAVAYFAIPIALLIVRQRRGVDLSYPCMFAMFAAFIVACGLTHLVHALQMPWTTFEHTAAESAVKAVCALLPIGTAGALIAIMPTVLRLVSPLARQEELECQISERTTENRHLVREINHRLGNQLQVMTSLVRLERRRAREPGQMEISDWDDTKRACVELPRSGGALSSRRSNTVQSAGAVRVQRQDRIAAAGVDGR